MPKAKVLHTQTFEDQLIQIGSLCLVDRVSQIEELLATMPRMGSSLLRPSLTDRFGPGIRKIVVGPYDIIYRYTEGRVIMLAVISARIVR
ncbi:MAG: type II toxin-antitoxin system RelE/ParE family toxin [Atopobiaceae bacterium]